MSTYRHYDKKYYYVTYEKHWHKYNIVYYVIIKLLSGIYDFIQIISKFLRSSAMIIFMELFLSFFMELFPINQP